MDIGSSRFRTANRRFFLKIILRRGWKQSTVPTIKQYNQLLRRISKIQLSFYRFPTHTQTPLHPQTIIIGTRCKTLYCVRSNLPQCSCLSSSFVYSPFGHMVTDHLDITNNNKLRILHLRSRTKPKRILIIRKRTVPTPL